MTIWISIISSLYSLRIFNYSFRRFYGRAFSPYGTRRNRVLETRRVVKRYHVQVVSVFLIALPYRRAGRVEQRYFDVINFKMI